MAWFTAYEEAARVRDTNRVGFTRHLVVCSSCGCDEITCAELGRSCAAPTAGADVVAPAGIESRLTTAPTVGEAAQISRVDPAGCLVEVQGARS